MEHRENSKIDTIGQILARGIIAMQLAQKASVAVTNPPVGRLNEEGINDTLIDFLASRPGVITCSAVASHLEVSISTARNRLNELVTSGKIRREGKGPSTRYKWIRGP